MNELTGQLVQYGQHRQRRSYARISEVLELPNLIEIQTAFLSMVFRRRIYEKCLRIFLQLRTLQVILSLEFIDYSLAEPKYSVEESKERDVTYAAPLRVKVRLV